MSKVFDAQVKHYKEKFYNTVDNVDIKTILSNARGNGVSDEFLKAGLLENTKEFRSFVYSYSKTLMPGRVSCTTYAAVVAVIADYFGLKYKVMTGFCLPKTNPRYEAELEEFNKRKATDEHPLLATHVYLDIDGVYYEYYNGDTSNIDHIDCIEINRG